MGLFSIFSKLSLCTSTHEVLVEDYKISAPNDSVIFKLISGVVLEMSSKNSTKYDTALQVVCAYCGIGQIKSVKPTIEDNINSWLSVADRHYKYETLKDPSSVGMLETLRSIKTYGTSSLSVDEQKFWKDLRVEFLSKHFPHLQ